MANAKKTQKKELSREMIQAAEEQIVEQSKRIEFFITEYSVELLADKMESGEFVVPAYQREYIWEPERKSRFIESLLMGLPIPFLFFWEMPTGKLEIVDGSQRLRTIHEFIKAGFRLGDLDSLSKLSGFSFEDLPEARQRKIKNRSIRGIVLNEHADEQARFDMFERINTGSKIANTAEVRRGALAGPFMDLIIELSKLPNFEAIAPVPPSAIKLREREELVSRFFAYGDGLEGYKDRPSEFIFNYVKNMNAVFAEQPEVANDYRQKFVRVVDFIGQVFPDGFRRTPNGKATPRARFEAIALGTRKALEEQPQLTPQDVNDVSNWIYGKDFSGVTGSDGANAIARLTGRRDFVYKKLVNE